MPAIKGKKRAAANPAKVQSEINLDHIADQLRPLAVDVTTLVPDPANARKHPAENLAALKASLRVYGQRKPIVVNKRNNVIEAGNGTFEAAQSLGWTHIAAVLVDDDPMTATGFSIADNRSAELAEWDKETLAKLIGEMEGVDEELQKAFDELAEAEGIEDLPEPGAGGDEFDATPAEGPTRCKTGDLWLIGGKHRLLIGDSTKTEDVGRLMGGEKVGLCFTSPPYGQQRDYGEAAKEKCQDWHALMCGVFTHLPMADGGQVLVNLGLIHCEGEWQPYWQEWVEWMRQQGWKRFGWYVWDQGFGLPGNWNGRLAPSFEYVFHFNKSSVEPDKWVEKKPENIKPRNKGESTMRGKDGKTKAFTNPEASGQPTKIPDSVIRIARQVGSNGHPAQFPIGLPQFMIESWPSDIYEPFAGSGTTLIAAHRLNRRCYGIEIEPKYGDVILKRAEAEGLTCVLEC